MPAKPTFDPRQMMEKAVEVMKRSVAERRDDKKASPLVGAVLVKPDGSIEPGVPVLAFEERIFGVVAFAQLAAMRRFDAAVRLDQNRAHQRTRLVVVATLRDGSLHDLDGLLHHLARIEYRLRWHGTVVLNALPRRESFGANA